MLRKTIYTLAMQRGINTGRDPKTITTELSQLENGLLDRAGAITKRCGLTYNSSYTEQFLTKRDERPVLIDQSSIRVFDGAAGASSGNFDQVTTAVGFSDITPTAVTGVSGAAIYHVDMCRQTNFTVYSYVVRDAPYYVCHIDVVDNSTGAIISQWSQVALGNYIAPVRLAKCGSVTHGFYVYYVSPNSLVYHIEVSAAGVVGSPALAEASLPNAAAQANLDACELDDANHTMLVCYVGTSGTVEAFTWNTAFVEKRTISHVASYLQTSCYKHATNVGMLIFSTTSTVYALGVNDLCAAVAHDGSNNPVAIYSLVANWDCMCSTGLATGTGTSRVYLSLTIYPGSYRWQHRAVTRDTLTVTAGVITNAGSALHVDHAALASKAFGASSNPHVLIQYHGLHNTGGTETTVGPAQHNYFLLDDTARPVGKALIGRAGYSTYLAGTIDTLCSVATSGSTYYIGVTERSSVSPYVSATGWQDTAEASRITQLAVTLGAPSSLKTCECNKLLYIPNSVPYLFDGKTFAEAGFLIYPEGLSASTTTTGTGVLVDGKTYGYAATLEVTDTLGNVHESSPSPPVSVAVASPYNTATISVRVPSTPDGQSSSRGYMSRWSGMRVVLYRTDADGSIYYRLAAQGVDRATLWSTSGTVSFVDYGCSGSAGVEDAAGLDLGPSYTGTSTTLLATSGSAQIYTTGGVIENIQPPQTRVMCVHQGRLFMVDREKESTRVIYSRWLVDGDGPGINDVCEVLVPEEGGRITALIPHQDRLLICKESMIYMTYGNGLSDNGSGTDYATPLLLSSGYGCTTQKSVVRLPDGVAFLSNVGLVLVGLDFQVARQFGVPVKYYTDTLTISAAALIAEKQYAIWTTTTGLALVYCYGFGQWATFTNHEATDAVECNGILYHKYGVYVRAENRSSWVDNASDIIMKIVTGMIPLSEVEGYGRCYKIVAIGQNISPHKLNIHPRYDLNAVWNASDKVQFDANTFGYAYNYGEYYGSGLATTYENKAYELTARVRKTKERCIQVMVYDEADGVHALGEGYSLTKLQLVIGIREPWIRKLAAREAT